MSDLTDSCSKIVLGALLGTRLNHSLSPKIYRYLAKEDQSSNYFLLDWKAKDFSRANLREFFEPFNFINLTFPFKAQIFYQNVVDGESPLVSKIQSANLLQNKEGQWVAKNTDYYALEKLILENEINPRRAVIIGSGGSARTMAFLLDAYGVNEIDFVSRNSSTKKNWMLGLSANCQRLTWTEFIESRSKEWDVLVNASPAEASFLKQISLPSSKLTKDKLILDMNYAPKSFSKEVLQDRRLFEGFKERGFTVIDGLDMLAWQGIFNWELVNGHRGSEQELIKLKGLEQVFSGLKKHLATEIL